MFAASNFERRLSRSIAIAIVAFSLATTTSVAAQTDSANDPKAAARAAYDLAERASGEMHFSKALAAYDRAIVLDPSAPFVRVARARVADLRAHAEGDFAPLTHLERIRRNPVTTREDIETLARDASSFPPGRVRSEAQLVVAEAFWHRFGAPDLAASALHKVLDDASADRLTRALALTELVAIERERDRLDAAVAVTARFPDLAPNLTAELRRLVRRVWLGKLAWGGFGAVVLLGLIGMMRAILRGQRDVDAVVRTAVKPSSVGFALYIGGMASILVRVHGEGDVRPFLWLGFGVLVVDVAARAWREGFVDERGVMRGIRSLACVIAVLAVAFLALQNADAAYLETIGL